MKSFKKKKVMTDVKKYPSTMMNIEKGLIESSQS